MHRPCHILLCALLLACSSYLSAQVPPGAETAIHQVYFEVDQDRVSAEEASDLTAFLMHLPGELVHLEIYGHTDADGTNGYNVNLSQQRTEAVATLLEFGGWRIQEKDAHGESRPVDDNYSDSGKANNRRVEVLASYMPWKPRVTLTELMEFIYPDTQYYCIDITRDTLLECEDGSMLHFPEYPFDFANSQRCVEIRVVEALRKEDMTLAELNTQSGDDWLESAGMVCVEAWQRGRKLELDQGKQVSLILPAEFKMEGMQTFYADEDMNWEVDEEAEVMFTPASYIQPFPDADFGDSEQCRLFFCKILNAFRPKERRVNSSTGAPITEFALPEKTEAAREEMMEFYGADTVEELQKKWDAEDAVLDDMQFNGMKISRLGWINCDRFIVFPEVTEVICSTDQTTQTRNFMVFESINSVLPVSGIGGEVSFPNVPVGEKVMLLSIRVNEGEPELATHRFYVEKDHKMELEYASATPEEVEQQIEQFIR